MGEVGRPTLYSEEVCKLAEKLADLGATDVEIADALNVATSTVYLWKIKHPEFSEALKAGKEKADARVERGLYQRAVGYTFDSEKIVTVSDGKEGSHIERVPIREHVPPDTTAQIFWLKNRKPEEWRDRIVHAGDPDNPITVARPYIIIDGTALEVEPPRQAAGNPKLNGH